MVTVIKEAQPKQDDELTKLQAKYEKLVLKSNGQMMKIMTLEARLIQEINRTSELKAKISELENRCVMCDEVIEVEGDINHCTRCTP